MIYIEKRVKIINVNLFLWLNHFYMLQYTGSIHGIYFRGKNSLILPCEWTWPWWQCWSKILKFALFYLYQPTSLWVPTYNENLQQTNKHTHTYIPCYCRRWLNCSAGIEFSLGLRHQIYFWRAAFYITDPCAVSGPTHAYKLE